MRALDPEVAAWLAGLRRDGLDHFERIDAFSPRTLRRAMDAQPRPPGVEVGRVEDRVAPGPGGGVPVRIYWPAGPPGPRPVVVFFHGGGWVTGSVARADALVRRLVDRSGLIFVSVDYRLAPEHRFPAAVEDCWAATAWVVARARHLGGDPTRVAVAGESAGGNLAAVVALVARDRGGPQLAFQALVYPCTDMDPDAHRSYRENGSGYFLTAAAMAWFSDHYAPAADRSHPYAAPLRAPDLSGLPDALVVTAGFDPLRDEGAAYARRLRDAGVTAEELEFPGMVHGFFSMDALFAAAASAQDAVSVALCRALGTDSPELF